MTKCLYLSYDGLLEPLGQSQIIPYLKGLSARGLKFVLLSFDKKKYLDKERVALLRRQLGDAGIDWVSLRYHKKPQVISTLFDILTGLCRCLFIVNKNKISIVHARGYVTGLIGYCLKKICGVKFIFDTRGFWADEKAEAGHWDSNGLLFRLAKHIERILAINADEVVALTRAAVPLLQENRTDKGHITVIPCCVDTNLFMPGLDSGDIGKRLNGKFVFAHTGSLEAWYMKDEMLDYFKLAKTLIPNAHFLVLSHSPKDGFLKLAAQKGLGKQDITVESVLFTDMPRYLGRVDVGMIFLGLGFSKLGCSPTKFPEFLSCGVPVVTNNKIGDTEEIIMANRIGAVINSFNNAEYERSLRELLVLKNDNGLKTRCRKVAEEYFSLSSGIEKYYAIYSKL